MWKVETRGLILSNYRNIFIIKSEYKLLSVTSDLMERVRQGVCVKSTYGGFSNKTGENSVQDRVKNCMTSFINYPLVIFMTYFVTDFSVVHSVTFVIVVHGTGQLVQLVHVQRVQVVLLVNIVNLRWSVL
jgi:hypothetical protein